MSLSLDLITLGRASVDLYGEQVGGRLEDMSSFAKYLGGSPTNTAVGSARLGLKVGMITRVGDDHMGRFIRKELEREGVNVAGVRSDCDRLTALVILGIRDQHHFPLIFYRENCADMALCAADISTEYAQSAGALLINGTHLSRPNVFAASTTAARAIKASGGKVIFDIDYRPVLWGLTSKDNGDDRFVPSSQVTAELRRVLALCDLIVGTEEEIRILGGSSETLAALRDIRSRCNALLVCKRGPDGCVAFPGAIPDSLDEGIVGKRFAVEVFNVLGAGDAFMAGFLRGWLKDEPIERCCTWGNACGAIVVSRHGCAPAEPTWQELTLFLSRNDWPYRLHDSAALEQAHWATTRHSQYADLKVLAIDHRSQFETLISTLKRGDAAAIARFKELALDAIGRVAGIGGQFGLLADEQYGMRALERAADLPYWIGRAIEIPGSRPLRFEGGDDVGSTLRTWPLAHVAKCLVHYHPDDSAGLRAEQETQLKRLFDACRSTRHELLLEIIASKHGPINGDTVALVIERLYAVGIFPDWWKLEPAADAETWMNIERAIQSHDPECRGVLLLGLSAPVSQLLESFAIAAPFSLVKGFAIGRSVWQNCAERWLTGMIDDEGAIDAMAASFSALVKGWQHARHGHNEIESRDVCDAKHENFVNSA
jgi:5-dehydro-2-deoxygluconokinase